MLPSLVQWLQGGDRIGLVKQVLEKAEKKLASGIQVKHYCSFY